MPVSRRGDDEFVLLLGEVEQTEQTEQVAKACRKPIKQIARPISVGEREISVGVSIALFPDDAEDQQTLLTAAGLRAV